MFEIFDDVESVHAVAIEFYLFSVIHHVDQPIILVQNSAVQRLEIVHRHPVINSLPKHKKTKQIPKALKYCQELIGLKPGSSATAEGPRDELC